LERPDEDKQSSILSLFVSYSCKKFCNLGPRTAQQFLKLEKVEIGGLRGKALSNRIICVHEEFKVI
jgi:hypothetical protein